MDKHHPVGESLQNMSFEAILVAVLVVIVTLVVFFLKRLLSPGKRYVLLTGLNDTGKTLIYSHLIYNRHVATYTSSQNNVGQFITDKKEVTVVDLPGFHSVRQQFFEKFKDASKGIVFVVDSVTLAQNVRDAANVLYNILIDPVVIKNKPQLLVLCNKQDQTLAKGSNVIKSMLEKELNTLRNTQLNQLQQLDSSEGATDKLGDPSKEFSFANLYCKVEFAESHAFSKGGSVELEALKKWIRKVTN